VYSAAARPAYCVWNAAAPRTDVRSTSQPSSHTRVPSAAPKPSLAAGLFRIVRSAHPMGVLGRCAACVLRLERCSSADSRPLRFAAFQSHTSPVRRANTRLDCGALSERSSWDVDRLAGEL
jgi:hypothetical protein